MEPKIVEKEAFKIVGLRKMFTAETTKEIPELWNQFMAHIPQLSTGEGMPVCYGACYHDPSQPMEASAEFEQIAAVEFKEGVEIPDGLIVRDVEDCKYAVFTHKGKLGKLTDTYNYIYGVWSQREDVKLKAGHMFEYYDEHFNPESNESEIFIYVPIE